MELHFPSVAVAESHTLHCLPPPPLSPLLLNKYFLHPPNNVFAHEFLPQTLLPSGSKKMTETLKQLGSIPCRRRGRECGSRDPPARQTKLTTWLPPLAQVPRKLSCGGAPAAADPRAPRGRRPSTSSFPPPSRARRPALSPGRPPARPRGRARETLTSAARN